MSGALRAPAGVQLLLTHAVVCCLQIFFPLQTPWPVEMAGDHCSQGACCPLLAMALPFAGADMAFPCTDGCSKAEGVGESLLGSC